MSTLSALSLYLCCTLHSYILCASTFEERATGAPVTNWNNLPCFSFQHIGCTLHFIFLFNMLQSRIGWIGVCETSSSLFVAHPSMFEDTSPHPVPLICWIRIVESIYKRKSLSDLLTELYSEFI